MCWHGNIITDAEMCQHDNITDMRQHGNIITGLCGDNNSCKILKKKTPIKNSHCKKRKACHNNINSRQTLKNPHTAGNSYISTANCWSCKTRMIIRTQNVHSKCHSTLYYVIDGGRKNLILASYSEVASCSKVASHYVQHITCSNANYDF